MHFHYRLARGLASEGFRQAADVLSTGKDFSHQDAHQALVAWERFKATGLFTDPYRRRLFEAPLSLKPIATKNLTPRT